MRWPTAMLLAALSAAGCRSSQPTFDPFLPRMRIPPPPTGSATGAPDAYYTNPTPPLTGSSAPLYTPPAASPPAGTAPNNLYAPPGGYQYQQPSPTLAPGSSGYAPTPGPVPRTSATSGRPTDGVASSDYGGNGSQTSAPAARVKPASYVRTAYTQPSTVYEHGGPVDAGSSSPRHAADDAPSDPVDIMDLPPVTRTGGQVD